MDQLKPVLEQLRKHLFWILTSLVLLLAIGGYLVASSALDKAFEAQKSALDSHYSNVSNVRSLAPTHPNEYSKQKMEEIVNRLAQDVYEAWQQQFQRQARFLVWPDSIKETNPALVRKLQAYMPVELKLEFPEEPANIAKTEKQAYAAYFDRQMPELAKIIGVEWVGEVRKSSAAGGYGPGMGGPGMGGPGMGGGYGEEGYGESYGEGYPGMGPSNLAAAASKPRDVVVWPKASQDELINSIRLWVGDTPTVYEILYTQENMWILEGLLNIIKQTNGDAQYNFQTVVREIEFIRIGRPAVGQAGQIDGAASGMGGYGLGGLGYGGPGMGGAGYGEDMYGDSAYGYGEGEGGEESSEMSAGPGGATAGASALRDPADGRYVDANFQPLSGDELREKMRSSSPEDAYFAVAKRVPVRLRLKVDQRKLLDLMANCGNADMMLEIRQVRLGDTVPAPGPGGGAGMGSGNMFGPGAGPGLGGFGGDYGGGEYGGGEYGGGEEGSDGYGYGAGYGEAGMGMPGMGGPGGGMFGMASGRPKVDPYLIDVELYGVVYLFNPPDISRLGLDKVTAETEIDTTADAPIVEQASDRAPAGNQTEQPAGGANGGGQQPAEGGGAGQPNGAAAGTGAGAQAGGTPAGAPPAQGGAAPGGAPGAGQARGGQSGGPAPAAGGGAPGGAAPGGPGGPGS